VPRRSDPAEVGEAPPDGLPTWSVPDPSRAFDNYLAGGLPVQVVEETTGWAHIRCDNGWEAWVDGRALVPVGRTARSPASGAEALTSLAVWLPIAGATLAIVGSFLPWYSQGGFDASAWDIRFVSLSTHQATDAELDTGPALLVLVIAWGALVSPPRASVLAT
jgi:hypothetical protein